MMLLVPDLAIVFDRTPHCEFINFTQKLKIISQIKTQTFALLSTLYSLQACAINLVLQTWQEVEVSSA